MIGIHEIHRKMAAITLMSTDKEGYTEIGYPELKLLIPLLRKNLEFVQKLDELKNLAYHAYEMGDMEWHGEICIKIEELEAQMI